MENPPSAFSNHLEKWIYRKCMGSVVSVEFRPISADKVFERCQLIQLIPKRTAAYRTRVRECKMNLYSTGAIVGHDEEGDIYILTCAHALGMVFNSQNPITAAGITRLYETWILCDHGEQRFQRGEINQRVRVKANVIEVNCANDLLLIQVPRQTFVAYCDQQHSAVSFGSCFPSAFTTAVMLSWPCSRNRTAVRGNVSHGPRDIGDLAQENPYGFTTKLSEIDITSDAGSSGAPLFDSSGDGIGVLHGGDGRLSYFIPLDVVRQCLTQWGWVDYDN